MCQNEQIGQHDQNDQNKLAKDKMSQHEST